MLLLECSPEGNHRLGLHLDVQLAGGCASRLFVDMVVTPALPLLPLSLSASCQALLIIVVLFPAHIGWSCHHDGLVWNVRVLTMAYWRRLVEVAVEILKIRDPAPMLGKSQSWACADDVIFRRLPTRVWKHRPCIPGKPGRWRSNQQSTFFGKSASLSDFLCKWCFNVVLGDVLGVLGLQFYSKIWAEHL